MQNSILPIVVVGRSLIQKFARQSGWLQRADSDRALTPSIFIQALVASVCFGQRSLRELAIEVGLLSGKSISKQGLSKRINAKAVDFLKQVTAEALRTAACSAQQLSGQIDGITRILVGDSSTLALHHSLAEHFPGATNHTDKTAAQMRFQLTFDILGGRWLQAALDPYKRNDKRAALDIVGTIVQAGDLIIRDLGYATIKCFREIENKGAYFLSRLLPNVRIFDASGNDLDILKLARAHAPCPGDTFTKRIQMGADERFNCRLVIIRVPKEIGDKRRRHLNEEAKRRGKKSHRKAYLELQDWMIFVTNLNEQQAGDKQLHELYQLRWRIENIFKLSKSQTALLKVASHRTNRYHAETLIWSWLLMMITLSGQGMFRLCAPCGPASPAGEVEVIEASIYKSIGKIVNWFGMSIELACAVDIPTLMGRLASQQEYHDRYEKRQRISMPARLNRALEFEPNLLLG
jgi:hypothetical protein